MVEAVVVVCVCIRTQLSFTSLPYSTSITCFTTYTILSNSHSTLHLFSLLHPTNNFHILHTFLSITLPHASPQQSHPSPYLLPLLLPSSMSSLHYSFLLNPPPPPSIHPYCGLAFLSHRQSSSQLTPFSFPNLLQPPPP